MDMRVIYVQSFDLFFRQFGEFRKSGSSMIQEIDNVFGKKDVIEKIRGDVEGLCLIKTVLQIFYENQ